MSFVVAYHTGGASGSPELPGATVNATTSFFERLAAAWRLNRNLVPI